jgi:hypothetical protein
MEEGVLFKANIDEHGVEAWFYIADDTLEDGANDIFVVHSFDGVFLERSVLEQSNSGFEFLAIDNYLISFG